MSETDEKKGLTGLWDRLQLAVRDNKSINLAEQVERYTSEFTLVVENLVAEETKLRNQLDNLKKNHDALANHVDAGQRSTDSEIDDLIKHTDQVLKEQDKRLSELQARLEKLENRHQPRGLAALGSKNMLSQLILLASIVCGSLVLVSIIGLFRP